MNLKKRRPRKRRKIEGAVGLVGLPGGMEVGAEEGVSFHLGVEGAPQMRTGWRELGG